MTGSWNLKWGEHSHFVLTFGNDDKKEKLFFDDIRNFGTIKISFGTDNLLDKKLNSIGKPWLNDERKPGITEIEFIDLLNKYDSQNICCFLINQKYISGIGNYLLSEVLYSSKINPWTDIKDISNGIRILLYNEILRIIQESYNLDGVSIRDYHGLDGQQGEFQNNLNVYQKKIDPNGISVIKKIGPHKRSIHYIC